MLRSKRRTVIEDSDSGSEVEGDATLGDVSFTRHTSSTTGKNSSKHTRKKSNTSNGDVNTSNTPSRAGSTNMHGMGHDALPKSPNLTNVDVTADHPAGVRVDPLLNEHTAAPTTTGVEALGNGKNVGAVELLRRIELEKQAAEQRKAQAEQRALARREEDKAEAARKLEAEEQERSSLKAAGAWVWEPLQCPDCDQWLRPPNTNLGREEVL